MCKVSDVLINDISKKLVGTMSERGMTLGFAESCTGGLISKSVTDIPGASSVFLGGVVSYANSVKSGVLGVDKKTLDTVGAVSADTAMQMALGCAEALGADIAVSVTGIAGPDGGTDEKPVGLVYIAVCQNEKIVCERNIFSGDRESVRMQSAYRALSMALDAVERS